MNINAVAAIKVLKMVQMSAVKYKLMPTGLDIDLDLLKTKIQTKLTEFGGIFGEAEEKPIAFGLKALVVSFAFPEEKEIDEVGNALETINGVSSVEMIDYRRAIG